MSVSRFIASIIILTYGSGAILLDRAGLEKLSLGVGPYYDTLGDYYVEDPIMEAYSDSDNSDTKDIDYEEDWEHSEGIMGRQLPQSGEVKINQDKKSQTWCKVQKYIRTLKEPGYEFYPKSYSEYDCRSHTMFDGSSENSIFSTDTCAVKDVKCRPLQKTFTFFKWPTIAKSMCSLIKVEKTVNVGCNCVNHIKYHFQK